MNKANKLTILKVVLSIVIVTILLLPFETLGLDLPKLFVNELIVIDVKYLLAGVLFIFAALISIINDLIIHKKKDMDDTEKMMNVISNKLLVSPVLIILSATGFVHPIIPVIIVGRDIFVNAFRMTASSKGVILTPIKLGKIKNVFVMLGIIFTLFYNMPFETMNIKISDFLLIIGTTLSVVSAVEYYNLTRKYLVSETRVNESVMLETNSDIINNYNEM